MRDLLLVGARVHLPAGELAEGAVWIREGRIHATGPARLLRTEAGSIDSVDLRGRRLLPGWVDTHTHFFELARRRAGVDLAAARDPDEVRELLRAHRARLVAGQSWIGGGGWDPGRYGGHPAMDRTLLDEVFPDHAVALESRDFHTLWCNTRALRACGVLDGTAAPPGGRIGRRADGSPDGFLHEMAWDLVWAARPVEDDAVASAWIRETMRHAHALGLTEVHCMEPMSTYGHYRRLAERDELRLRITFHTPRADLSARIDEGAASYRPEDPWLRRGGVKIFGDGSLGSRTAWMTHPYPDGTHGGPLLSEDELQMDLERAAAAGIAPTVHAIGDRTLEMVLRCFQRVRRSPSGPELLLRVEHAQCVPPAAVQRLARLQVYCAVQPVHLRDDVPLLPREWGRAADWAYPLRSLTEAGVALGMGSDAPVAPLDPRLGLVAAVARRGVDGGVWRPEEALTLPEALHGYTAGAAAGGAWAGETGVIAKGMRADLMALDDVGLDDVMAWPEAATRLTVVGGEIVYEALG